MVFASQINVFHENKDFRFSVWLVHSMESMDSIDSMESMESMESEVKNPHGKAGTRVPSFS